MIIRYPYNSICKHKCRIIINGGEQCAKCGKLFAEQLLLPIPGGEQVGEQHVNKISLKVFHK